MNQDDLSKFDRIFWIAGDVPSSKNGKRPIRRGADSFVVSSKATYKYMLVTKQQYLAQKKEFTELIKTLPTPIYLELTFVRATKHIFDYTNKGDTVMDAMVKYEWILDDNNLIVKPYYGDFEYNKVNPGCKIKILPVKPIHEPHKHK